MCCMTHNRVHLYVPDDTLAVLDAKRGAATRSAYIRWLIEAHPHPDPVVPPVEPAPVPSPPQPLVPPTTPPIPPDPPIEGMPLTGPSTRVTSNMCPHPTWEKQGSIFKRCTSCGETVRR